MYFWKVRRNKRNALCDKTSNTFIIKFPTFQNLYLSSIDFFVMYIYWRIQNDSNNKLNLPSEGLFKDLSL